ncbi:HAMP domain-containing protein [Candidatus Woesearchaeota archaeon]|nr:HAMP domain-containing protein [Candidatus Woesearchaeota archaeon]
MATKKLIELYIETHPEKTAADLINDTEFQSIGIQPVGKKGYTVVIQTKTQNMIAHPNPAMMGKDLLEPLQNNEKMQDWWRVVEPTWKDNVDNSGYYHWPEADGTYSDKYMYLAVIDTPLQGKDLSIAATTYTDEFNAPAKLMDEKLSTNKDSVVSEIQNTKRKIQQTTTITVLAMIAAITALSILFSRRLTKPITKLRNAAVEIGKGNFESHIDIKTEDEIGELANTFNSMVEALNASRKALEEYNKNLEEKVHDRTSELKKKSEEQEKLNAIVVGRELKMVELKKKIAELEKKLKKK